MVTKNNIVNKGYIPIDFCIRMRESQLLGVIKKAVG